MSGGQHVEDSWPNEGFPTLRIPFNGEYIPVVLLEMPLPSLSEPLQTTEELEYGNLILK